MRVGGEPRRLFLKQETGDPDVAAVSLSTATASLQDALDHIAKLAKKAEKPKPAAARGAPSTPPPRPVWSLVLDEIHDRGLDLRPRLPFRGPRDFTGPDRTVREAALASAALDDPETDPARPADCRRRRGLPERDRAAAERPPADPERPARPLLSRGGASVRRGHISKPEALDFLAARHNLHVIARSRERSKEEIFLEDEDS